MHYPPDYAFSNRGHPKKERKRGKKQTAHGNIEPKSHDIARCLPFRCLLQLSHIPITISPFLNHGQQETSRKGRQSNLDSLIIPKPPSGCSKSQQCSQTHPLLVNLSPSVAELITTPPLKPIANHGLAVLSCRKFHPGSRQPLAAKAKGNEKLTISKHSSFHQLSTRGKRFRGQIRLLLLKHLQR